MAVIDATDRAREVRNQAPLLQPIDPFRADLAPRAALERAGGDWGVDGVHKAGAAAGSFATLEHGRAPRASISVPRFSRSSTVSTLPE